MATNRRGHVGPGACCGRPPWTARSNSRCRPAPKAPHLLHHHRKMNLSEEVDLEDYVARPDKISGADINSICQEGGMLAVRENRYIVLAKDFEKAYKTVIKKDEQEHEFYK
eukprot:XP_025002185.1 26S proteasome regulatory subunit 6B-like isoform X1 [Gallus gallus]